MKKLMVVLVACFVLGIAFLGCSGNKAASSIEAIQNSKELASVQAKVDYLVQQAKAFYSSKQFQDAVNISQYVLSNLDKNSQEAKSLLEKAKEQLSAAVQKKADELKSKMGMMGK